MVTQGYRVAMKEKGSNKAAGEYTPSTTEVFLEKICSSFGTELLPAYLDTIKNTLLVRVSEPAIVMHPDGTKRVVQFQLTKFSPLSDINKIAEVQKRDSSEIYEEIRDREEKPWNFLKEVTDPHYIPSVTVHRFRKELYIEVYDVTDKKGIERKLKPFKIHERPQLGGKYPEMDMTFRIEPWFATKVTQDTSGIYDMLSIDFPEIEHIHSSCVNSALSFHPLNNLSEPENPFKKNDNRLPAHYYEIHSRVPRQLSMGFISAYLRKFCLDEAVL